MTIKEKRSFQEAFWRKAGMNLRSALAMIDTIPGAAFYVKDSEGRFIANNRRACEICGIASEDDIIGLTSADIFPPPLSRSYQELDRKVRESGKPVVKTTDSPTGDFSTDHLVKSVFPVWSRNGCIGTMCVYHQTPAQEAMPAWHGRLRALTAYIVEHFDEPMTVAALARRAGMTPKSLEAAFRLTLGTSVAKFITMQRLSASRRLLENTDRSITEIAADCGFFDHSHFAKAFARRWGISPGAYRKKARGAQLAG